MTGTESSWLHPVWGWLALGTLASLWVWRRWGRRRALQVASLVLFVSLLWLAAQDGEPTWPVDFFLFSDPLLAGVATLAGRMVVGLLGVSLAFVALAALMGRVFCSHVCPLGTLLDVTDRVVSRAGDARDNHGKFTRARSIKFIVLLIVLGAAGLGLNLLGFVDPMVLSTRFFATLFHPLLVWLSALGIEGLRPLADRMDWFALAYSRPEIRVFEGTVGTAILLAALVLLSRLQARFWCRHLCPLGALLAWLGAWAPFRRRVAGQCQSCTQCARKCPMGAIDPRSARERRGECIVCFGCVSTCPRGAVTFGPSSRQAEPEQRGPQVSRRVLVGAALGGAASGWVVRRTPGGDLLNDLHTPSLAPRVIRPPGALPEADFLARCVRCGECLRACVTNTLQPDWSRAGFEGLWAPHLNLRHAHCQQDCNVCGQVCPTQALRPLDLLEKRHARVGTVVIDRNRCLPWAKHEACSICEEQCPYGAVTLMRPALGRPGVPDVDLNRCNGCGRCEDQCPVDGSSAIVVIPRGELRLARGSYVEQCRQRGLRFEPKRNGDVGPEPFRFRGDQLPPSSSTG